MSHVEIKEAVRERYSQAARPNKRMDLQKRTRTDSTYDWREHGEQVRSNKIVQKNKRKK